MAERYGSLLRRLLRSAERLSERAMRLGSRCAKTPRLRSRALLRSVTRCDQRLVRALRVVMKDGVPQLSFPMIRKIKSGGYRLYSRKKNPKTARRRNLGTFRTRAAAQ